MTRSTARRAALFGALGLADAALTLHLIHTGPTGEANPAMRALIATSVALFFAVKGPGQALIGACLPRLVGALCLGQLAVVVWNLSMLGWVLFH